MAAKRTTILSRSFQICIPKPIRSSRRWQVGQMFAFIPKRAGLMLVPVPDHHELAGIAQGAEMRDFRDRSQEF
jgi:bifunctional DNA-binding transcriptional regulator/antitoxin component of YhaV-PrlF toxin-antitoxin module